MFDELVLVKVHFLWSAEWKQSAYLKYTCDMMQEQLSQVRDPFSISLFQYQNLKTRQCVRCGSDGCLVQQEAVSELL